MMEDVRIEGLEKFPDALANRFRLVTLSDGSSVRVEKWSWIKAQALVPCIGALDKVFQIAEASVAEADRARVRTLDAQDVMQIAREAQDLNVTEEFRRNLLGFLQTGARLAEAIVKSAPSSQPSASSAVPDSPRSPSSSPGMESGART